MQSNIVEQERRESQIDIVEPHWTFHKEWQVVLFLYYYPIADFSKTFLLANILWGTLMIMVLTCMRYLLCQMKSGFPSAINNNYLLIIC